MIETKLKKSFKEQIFSNIVSGWVAIFLVTIVGVLLTPTMLNNFGKEVYGIWFLIFNFIAYFYLADFGFTNAITRLFAKYNVDSNYDTSKLISTAFMTIIVIDLFLFIVLLTFKRFT
jgi:O-antigen/teichoic acid export membrane protein